MRTTPLWTSHQSRREHIDDRILKQPSRGSGSSSMCAPDKVTDALNSNEKNNGAPPSVNSSCKAHQTTKTIVNNGIPILEATTWTQKVNYAIGGALVGVAVSAFSFVFPLLMFRQAALKTYLFAAYQFVDEISRFDNTFWTYGTDYMIAVAMIIQIAMFPKSSEKTAIHSWRSKALLASYAFSVFFGGLCHQLYTECSMRQTWHFRFLWTLCVGCVTAAPGFMGGIATELVRQDEAMGVAFMPAVPAWFWAGFGITATIATALGFFSFQRPACDIFVAGVTQFPTTFYLMAMLAFGLPTYRLNRWIRYRGLVAFIMMSPLLPAYPLAVQYTNLSLGTVNGLLHSWLMLAWTMQGVTLRRICEAMQESEGPPPPSVPIKRKSQ